MRFFTHSYNNIARDCLEQHAHTTTHKDINSFFQRLVQTDDEFSLRLSRFQWWADATGKPTTPFTQHVACTYGTTSPASTIRTAITIATSSGAIIPGASTPSPTGSVQFFLLVSSIFSNSSRGQILDSLVKPRSNYHFLLHFLSL
jgi:hypothetical protein